MIDGDIILDNDIHCWKGTLHSRNWTLLCGDAVSALQTIETESINCIITSPPYYCLRDYEVEGQIGLEETVEEYVTVPLWTKPLGY